ncbi:MAG TPA: SDR family oxidoreductase [Polyangiales bacterium]|nr:SDR family oxidoreductase [Polyangiales bacterium]
MITGSSRGIGYALARRFLELGCRVTIAGRSDESTAAGHQQLADALPEKAQLLSSQTCDVSRRADLEALWEHASARAPVDIWINNAGVSPPPKLFWDVPASSLEDAIESNVKGAILGSWVAVRGMRAQKSGTIYNVLGFGSDGMIYPGALAYGASKRAIDYVTKALTKEARGSGVRVCSLQPGAVRTEMVAAEWEEQCASSRFMAAFIGALALDPDEAAHLLAPRVLANTREGAVIRPWSSVVSWARLLRVPWGLLRGALGDARYAIRS